MPTALFGIDSDALNLVVNLLVLFLVVLWIALIAWTYFDARRRIEDPVLVASATAASLFPFVGTVVYSILRPPEFLDDKRERELEIRAAELRLRQLEDQSCPNCEHPVERSYLRCPNCKARIHDPCEACGKPIDPRWSLCPYCETPVRRAAPPPERRAEPAVAPERPTAEQAATAAGRAAAKPKPKRQSRSRSTGQGARKATPSRGTRTQRTAKQRAAAAKQRKGGDESSTSSGATGRELPGEDKPRPAPAS
jgi:hypothetical protein